MEQKVRKWLNGEYMKQILRNALAVEFGCRFQIGCTVKADDIKSVDKLAEFVQDKITWWKGQGVIDLDESHEWLSKSWQYEHQIFDLVRLYKSIDWDKYTLIFLGR